MKIEVASESAANPASTGAPTTSLSTLDQPTFCRRNLIAAVVLFAAGLLSVWWFEWRFQIGHLGVSNAPHFVYQAEAFLHGHWNISLPRSVVDVVVINGKNYTIYPPFPALLMLPFVAIWGTNTSDVLFTAICSAIILSLLFLLFEQVRENGLTKRNWLENVCIALVCYFGSITLWLSLGGRLWFTAHIVAVMMTVLSLLLAFRRHFTWSAVALGCAFFSRGTLLVGFPFLLYLAWDDVGRHRALGRFAQSVLRRAPDWRAIPWQRLAGPLAVTVAIAVLYLARNEYLFGSPLESGYTIIIHQRYPGVTDGVFNVKYVPSNFIANFFSFPRVIFQSPYDRHPYIDMINGGYGSSVFFTTPLFLFLFYRNGQRSALRIALWLLLGVFTAQILLFHATGWLQFGARYLFEAYPYAFLLLVLNEVRLDWRFAVLGLLGVIINIAGAYAFWTGHIIQI